MRRLILRRTEKVPGSPDSRNQKFTRGPICGPKRPPPLHVNDHGLQQHDSHRIEVQYISNKFPI